MIQRICGTESLHFFNLGLPGQGSSVRGKTRHTPSTATLRHDKSVYMNTAAV